MQRRLRIEEPQREVPESPRETLHLADLVYHDETGVRRPPPNGIDETLEALDIDTVLPDAIPGTDIDVREQTATAVEAHQFEPLTSAPLPYLGGVESDRVEMREPVHDPSYERRLAGARPSRNQYIAYVHSHFCQSITGYPSVSDRPSGTSLMPNRDSHKRMGGRHSRIYRMVNCTLLRLHISTLYNAVYSEGL